jgi:peptidoglycan/LPS O-acetylase OafA/YrhL
MAAYGIAAGACLLAWRRDRSRLWLVVAGVMLLLGASRVMGWQDAATEAGREVAKGEGWYRERRPVQVAFITGVGVALVAGLGLLAWRLRRGYRWRHRLAAVVTTGLVGLAAVRMASLHQVDDWLTKGIGPVRVGRGVEVAGISIVTGAAFLRGRKDRLTSWPARRT